MHPLKLLTIYRRAHRLGDLLEDGQMNKALWKSKTFWFNVLTAATELTQVLPIPPGTLAIAAAVINIGLRVVTDQPVTVLPRRLQP